MVNSIRNDPSKLRGIKFKLYPTEDQKNRIKEISDLYRYIFNYTLEVLILNYYGMTKEEFLDHCENIPGLTITTLYKYFKPSGNKFISFVDMCKIVQRHRNENEWLKRITVTSARYAIRNVYNGYFRFFNKKDKNINRPPKFKSKKELRQSFAFRGERMRFILDPNTGLEYVKVEGIETPILFKKSMPFPKNAHLNYYSCTIEYDNYEYWLSFSVEIYNPIQFNSLDDAIGIDLGLRKFAVLSDGTIYKMPSTNRLEKRLRRVQAKCGKDRTRRLKKSKQAITKLENIPKSKRAIKREKRYHQLSNRIKNIKNTFIHTMTREIINRRPSCIVMENLNVKGLAEGKTRVSGQIYSNLFARTKHHMEYKCKNEGIKFILANPFYPSSQICSRCGNRYKVGSSEVYKCPTCGLIIDRDLNAALNLRSLATI